MTQEDLDQIRSLSSANNQVLFEAMRAIEDHVDQSIDRLRDELGGRLAHVERRLDHMETRFTSFGFELAGIGKLLTAGERLDSEMPATQTAQQRAIDDLARRLARVERQINPSGSQPGQGSRREPLWRDKPAPGDRRSAVAAGTSACTTLLHRVRT
jgi:hypothetical protein